jgi:hypothetical protein
MGTGGEGREGKGLAKTFERCFGAKSFGQLAFERAIKLFSARRKELWV